MIKKIIRENIGYLIAIFVLLVISIFVKYSFKDQIINLDNKIITFFQTHLLNDGNTNLMKIITEFGSMVAFLFVLIICFIFIKNKNIPCMMSLNLIWVYIIHKFFKNIIMRPRPVISLITKPKSYSFPSGHAACSIAFYGFIVYLICSNVKNFFVKWITIFIFSMLVIFISISRIYLNVHYFTDVIVGLILGLICLLMFINIYRKNIKE